MVGFLGEVRHKFYTQKEDPGYTFLFGRIIPDPHLTFEMNSLPINALPETNTAPEKMEGLGDDPFVLGRFGQFSGATKYVSFREGSGEFQ